MCKGPYHCCSRVLLRYKNEGFCGKISSFYIRDRQDSATYPLLLQSYETQRHHHNRASNISDKRNKKYGHCFSHGSPVTNCLKWLPVLFVILILSWSYYVYVVHFCMLLIVTPNSDNYENNLGDNKRESSHPPTTLEINPYITQNVPNQYVVILYLAVFNVLFILIVCSYVSVTVKRKRYTVPEDYRLGVEDLKALEDAKNVETIGKILEKVANSQLPAKLKMITIDGGPRYCDTCKLIKPDRTHHCMSCGRCVLKMDHHCPWINNCIQFGNYKQFILLLLYSLILCIFVIATILPFFVSIWGSAYTIKSNESTTLKNKEFKAPSTNSNNASTMVGFKERIAETAKFMSSFNIDLVPILKTLLSTRFNVLFLFFVAIMFGISLGTLFLYHCYLISRNRTTLESFGGPIFVDSDTREPNKDGFNLQNFMDNFKQVFGRKKFLWLFPVYSSIGDGIVFPTSKEVEPEILVDYKTIAYCKSSEINRSPNLKSKQPLLKDSYDLSEPGIKEDGLSTKSLRVKYFIKRTRSSKIHLPK